jgi:hypothetical protein
VTTFASRGRPASNPWVAVSAFLLLVLLGIAVAAVIVSIRSSFGFKSPLDSQSDGFGPDISSPLFYRGVSAPFGESTSYVLRFRPNSTFRFGMSLHNHGSAPLRIDGIVPSRTGCCLSLRYVGLELQHNPRVNGFKGATREPLTIPPNGDGWVIPVMSTGAKCYLVAGGGEIFKAVTLKYSYQGHHRTQEYPLPAAVGFACSHPERLLGSSFGPK